jgi:hypothetical protein
VPGTKQRWALPFLCVLATTPDVSQQLGLRHKTIGLRAHQLVSLLRRWLPEVPIKLLGALAYSILELGLQSTAPRSRSRCLPPCAGTRCSTTRLRCAAPTRWGGRPWLAHACPLEPTSCRIRRRCGSD